MSIAIIRDKIQGGWLGQMADGRVTGSGVYEKGMQIRVGSWSHCPREIGAQVFESTPGPMAHMANETFKLLKMTGANE